MLIRAIKTINKKLGEKKDKKRSSYDFNGIFFFSFLFFYKKGVTTIEFLKKILWMVIYNGINKIDIYVIKTGFDIITQPKVGLPGGLNCK